MAPGVSRRRRTSRFQVMNSLNSATKGLRLRGLNKLGDTHSVLALTLRPVRLAVWAEPCKSVVVCLFGKHMSFNATVRII